LLASGEYRRPLLFFVEEDDVLSAADFVDVFFGEVFFAVVFRAAVCFTAVFFAEALEAVFFAAALLGEVLLPDFGLPFAAFFVAMRSPLSSRIRQNRN